MPRTEVEIDRLRERLDEADFGGLLIGELGWDNPAAGQEVRHDEDGTIARLVADKRGVGIWVVDGLPGPGPRRRIDVLIARRTRERLIVFDGGAIQMWMWPEQHASGSGFRLVSHEYHVGSRNEALLQRLVTARFGLEEEDGLTVVDVLVRVRRSFNADRVTKKFYREFKERRDELLDQIEGIELEEEVAWYGSVLLNRLMLLYFLQKKGFLDDDPDYLRSRLRMVRDHLGDDSFYGFFKDFLLPLFHDGLGSHLQVFGDEEMAAIIGDVPYVNGGIFMPHVLEETYEIDVPDEAFEAVFAFFDRYRWHLDDTPTDDANEINPDVLGYVFEQFVNSKEMGAYYTKADVTGYMTSVTLLPAFLDRIAPVAGEPWALLSSDPDRYIPDSVRHGVDLDLPPEIAASAAEPFERPGWEDKAEPSHGHPGETWWEVVERRRHCDRLRARLAADEVVDIADSITENLDLRTLVDDHLRSLEDLEAVEATYDRLCALTVLDPTCGSGAFLFAALEYLADLYMALMERAEELAEVEGRMPGFVQEARRHPNLRYFVLRSAQLNNLYGVDIMPEAGEIARLRLFLKLAAQVDRREDLEPFPDLDLNVKTGNLLVGVATLRDAEQRLSADLLGMEELARINVVAEDLSRVFRRFVEEQAVSGDPVRIATLKADLDEHLGDLRRRLDHFLYERVGTESFDDWAASHLPFHWFVEFAHVFERGGFDVVIGNPPYIGAKKVTGYEWSGFRCDALPDIYAVCVERAASLTCPSGWLSMITPVSLAFSDKYVEARQVLMDRFPGVWSSTFGKRPSSLFAGVDVVNTIVVGGQSSLVGCRTAVHRIWVADFRPHLLPLCRYTHHPDTPSRSRWYKVGSSDLTELLEKMLGLRTVSLLVSEVTGSCFHFKPVARYWMPVSLGSPRTIDLDGNDTQANVARVGVVSDEDAALVVGCMAGSLGYFWWSINGDDLNVPPWIVRSFPIPKFSNDARARVLALSAELDTLMQDHLMWNKNAGKWISNYDLSRCRFVTKQLDFEYLRAMDAERLWPALESWYWTVMKSTGDPTGVVRGSSSPFI